MPNNTDITNKANKVITVIALFFDKLIQINSQIFLFTEVGKLALKLHSYLDRVRQDDNRELAKKLYEMNLVISEAVKKGDLNKIEEIVSHIGIPKPN